MPLIAACSHACGIQSINAEDLGLVIFVPAVHPAFYVFECPQCGLVTRRAASEAEVALLAGLVATGIVYLTTDSPHGPITEPEIESFAADLERLRWLA